MANSSSIERFHSRGRHLCKFIGTKESLYVRKGLVWNSNMAGRFTALEQQYGCHDAM